MRGMLKDFTEPPFSFVMHLLKFDFDTSIEGFYF